MNTTITFKEHLRATLLVLALIAIAVAIGILFCSSTPTTKITGVSYTENNTTQHEHWVNYPDSIMLRIKDFKYYWADDVRNWEHNEEWIVETAFNNDVDVKHVTQAMFNKRYGLHTIEYWSTHTRPLYHH